jgi:hypothetical protein
VVNRVLTIGGALAHLILKGDARRYSDIPVTPAQVLGRVVAVERNGRLFDPYSPAATVCAFLPRQLSRIKQFLSPAFRMFT